MNENKKENLLFHYVNSFEKMFYTKFPDRKHLFIVAENEYDEKVRFNEKNLS